MARFPQHFKLFSSYVADHVYPFLCLTETVQQIGWKPAPNQPKPLERGSAQTSLKDVLS